MPRCQECPNNFDRECAAVIINPVEPTLQVIRRQLASDEASRWAPILGPEQSSKSYSKRYDKT
jgi:hypothetical protein